MADTETTAQRRRARATARTRCCRPPSSKSCCSSGSPPPSPPVFSSCSGRRARTTTPLYSGLADRDIGEITAQLDSANVPYELDPATGSLLVPAERKYEVRMQLASSGLPRGAGFGIEEMPDRSSFGQTPFMENALYVRAVETELARTIGSMQPVEMARVHLGTAAAVGVLAAEARAERIRHAEVVRRGGDSTPSKCRPSCTSSRRACPISCRRA